MGGTTTNGHGWQREVLRTVNCPRVYMRVLGAFLIKFSNTLMVMLMVQGEDSNRQHHHPCRHHQDVSPFSGDATTNWTLGESEA